MGHFYSIKSIYFLKQRDVAKLIDNKTDTKRYLVPKNNVLKITTSKGLVKVKMEDSPAVIVRKLKKIAPITPVV